MSKELSKLWVDPAFKKMVKSKAAEKDMTIIDYTKFLADKDDEKTYDDKKKLKFFF